MLEQLECGGGGSQSAGQCNQDIKVGLALDVGGLGDKSFNDSAYTGLQNAIRDGLVCFDNTKFLEANATGSNRGENVTNLAEAGYNLIVGVGFAFSPDINEIAKDYPDQNFAVIDGYATCGTACGLTNDAAAIPNVADLTFTEQQGSFLVGAAAALEAAKLNCTTVGFLGGQTGPLIGKFQAGYTAGVHKVNPNIRVVYQYIGDDVTAFNDATKGEALSTGMYDDGACIIYHAAGASGAGLFNAAVKADKLAIGVDSDQYLTASAGPEAADPHVDDQAGRHGRLQRDPADRRRLVQGRRTGLRPGAPGIGLLQIQQQADDSGHHRGARAVPAGHHQRDDQGSGEAVTGIGDDRRR